MDFGKLSGPFAVAFRGILLRLKLFASLMRASTLSSGAPRGHAQSVINTDDLCVNPDTKMVEIAGTRVHLTAKEYQMLELLALRKGMTLSKEMFLSHLYAAAWTNRG